MSGNVSKANKIRQIFRTLEAAMGPQHWWPAGSAFEVVVGAYLTQNTAWTNVERAMEQLREAGVLSISGIRDTPVEELERLVRPAGYFRQKAARLKLFVAHLDALYGGSLEAMFERPVEVLREELLGLQGIGPETADSILLYAACGEVFVVDSYTRRIFERHGLAKSDTAYEEIRLTVQKALREKLEPRGEGLAQVDPDAIHTLTIHEPSAASAMTRSELSQRYNEFHALLVQTAKHYCVKGEPKCENCPLRRMLPRH
jgi:endonuclease-3 related protein